MAGQPEIANANPSGMSRPGRTSARHVRGGAQREHSRETPASTHEPRRILLLAMLPIGDTLFLTPTIRALRSRYPAAHLAALAYTSNAPLLCHVPAVDAVVEMPAWQGPRSLAAYIRLVADLRRQAYDVAVDFTSPAFKWISIGAGAPRRTYMKFDPAWWLLPTGHDAWRATHATRLYYDCAAELDLPPWEDVDHRPGVAVPAPARTEADAWLARAGVGQSGAPLVALHPGGKGLGGEKRWHPRHFAQVADTLRAHWGAEIVLLGGPDEQALADEVAASMAHPPALAVGRLSLLGTVALLARCDLFIGNDSSLLHLAACQGTPYVGIFGPTCLANFQPIPLRPGQGRLAVAWPPSRRVSYFVGAGPIWHGPAPHDARSALRSIPPDLVLGYAQELLAKRTAASAASDTAGAPVSVPRHTAGE